MDWRWTDGCTDGRPARQGRVRRLGLEPHPRQGRGRRAEGRKGRRVAFRSCRRRRAFHHAQHRQGRRRGLLRRGRHVPRGPQADAQDSRRLLHHRHGRVGGGSQRPRQAWREAPCRSGQRQSEMRPRGEILLRRLGPARRLRRGESLFFSRSPRGARPMPATASSRACARSPSTCISRSSRST